MLATSEDDGLGFLAGASFFPCALPPWCEWMLDCIDLGEPGPSLAVPAALLVPMMGSAAGAPTVELEPAGCGADDDDEAILALITRASRRSESRVKLRASAERAAGARWSERALHSRRNGMRVRRTQFARSTRFGHAGSAGRRKRVCVVCVPPKVWQEAGPGWTRTGEARRTRSTMSLACQRSFWRLTRPALRLSGLGVTAVDIRLLARAFVSASVPALQSHPRALVGPSCRRAASWLRVRCACSAGTAPSDARPPRTARSHLARHGPSSDCRRA